MAFEITCGQCSAQLLVESSGIVVECPLCGAHLSIPELAADGTVTQPTDLPADSAVVTATPASSPPADFAVVSGESVVLTGPVIAAKLSTPEEPVSDSPGETARAPLSENPAALSAGGESAEPLSSTGEPVPERGNIWDQERTAGPLTDEIPISPEEQQLSEDPTQVISKQQLAESMEVPGTEMLPPAEGTTSEEAPAVNAATTHSWGGLGTSTEPIATGTPPSASMFSMEGSPQQESLTAPPPPSATAAPVSADSLETPVSDTVPRQRFIMLAGYASAITLAFLYLLMGALRQRAHYLESLPDLVPEIRKDGAVGMKQVLPMLDVAPGHELELGQSQRFGNVVVTPVKVTRGPLTFQHAYGNTNAKQAPTQPVLKLWLKFENVSRDQEFPPLDRTLVYRRLFDEKLGVFSLNFLCEEDQRKLKKGIRHVVYDMPEFSEFTVVGQDLDHWVKPGETWETYIPSEEGLAEIDGLWVWRVLFRKGLNQQSGRGVTTLIDVHFSDKDIQAES